MNADMKNRVLHFTSILVCGMSLVFAFPNPDGNVLDPKDRAQAAQAAPPSIRPGLSCGPTFMNITLQRKELTALKVDLTNIHLRKEECLGSANSASTILIQSEVKEGACGTSVTVNKTHAIYKNDVYLPPDPSGLIYRDDYIINAACAYPRDMNVSLGMAVNPIISTKNISVEGAGEFQVKMALFKDPAYTIPREKGDELTTRDMLYFGVFIAKGDTTRFHLVMRNCYATPTQSYLNTLRYYIIRKSCKNEWDSTIHVAANGIASFGQFSVQAFRFIGYSSVFFHCQVHLCDREAGHCIPVCPAVDDGDSDDDGFELGLGGITIKDPSKLCPDLQCGASYINVTFQKSNLTDSSIDIPSLSLNEKNCHDLYDNGKSLTIGWPLGEGVCGTTLRTNATHAIYSNAIYLGPNPLQIIYREEYYINVSCVYPLNLNVSLPNVLNPFVNTTIFLIEGAGSFEVKMAAYRDAGYLYPYETGPVFIATHVRLHIGVFIYKGDTAQFNVALIKCYATPTPNPHDTKQYPLILHCSPNSEDGTVQIDANAVSSQGLFSFEMFRFINYNTVYLHCEVNLCNKQTNQCAQVCPNRMSRNAPAVGPILSLGPIKRQDIPETTPADIPETTPADIPETTPAVTDATETWESEATFDTTTVPATEEKSSTVTSKIPATTASAGRRRHLEVLTVLAVLFCWMLH